MSLLIVQARDQPGSDLGLGLGVNSRGPSLARGIRGGWLPGCPSPLPKLMVMWPQSPLGHLVFDITDSQEARVHCPSYSGLSSALRVLILPAAVPSPCPCPSSPGGLTFAGGQLCFACDSAEPGFQDPSPLGSQPCVPCLLSSAAQYCLSCPSSEEQRRPPPGHRHHLLPLSGGTGTSCKSESPRGRTRNISRGS